MTHDCAGGRQRGAGEAFVLDVRADAVLLVVPRGEARQAAVTRDHAVPVALTARL